MPESLEDIAVRIFRRDKARAEATLQADIRSFILTAGLNLDDNDVTIDVQMESQVGAGSRNRIDIEAGSTVIEVKRDLSKRPVMTDAKLQLAGYLNARLSQTENRWLGILTDGASWHLFVADPDDPAVLIPAGPPLITTSAGHTEPLRYWLGTVLATVDAVSPSAQEIARHFGSESPTHAADHATLRALFDKSGSRTKEVALKRNLWAKLLRAAFGSSFDDDPDLFVDHTLLVITAEIIAHAVLGYDVSRLGPLSTTELTNGSAFTKARIFGVVESDFFDWPLQLDGGDEFVRSLAQRISRFDWTAVEHDVLKHLYESVIPQDSRKALGEYYTPDWLASQMIDDIVTAPLDQRVLDPSCGSGTFLFHTVRKYLAAADDANVSNGEALDKLCAHVFGMDIHPVAVTLARVTYLLAIGKDRLSSSDRGALSIPVFLGDSLQWEQQTDLFSKDNAITVHTTGDEILEGGGGTLFNDDLVFPASVVADSARFDNLVRTMALQATDLSNRLDRTLIDPILKRFCIDDDAEKRILLTTFSTMRALHRSGRDHIWGYYIRNLVRPLWLNQAAHKVDVLVGNPPWLRYSKMTEAMQRRFLVLARDRNLLSGPRGASARDLSGLFVARSAELYLKASGKFAFVMPWGTLRNKPSQGFRSGNWSNVQVEFSISWDLAGASAATGFPMVAAVVRGRPALIASPLPAEVDRWTIKGGRPDMPWSVIESRTVREPGAVMAFGSNDPTPTSPYEKRFRSGAILYPRVLVFVTKEPAGPLGVGAGREQVRSRRSVQAPWKKVEPLAGVVEDAFIHPVHLGETILPFATLAPAAAVLPISLDQPWRLAEEAELEIYDAMGAWWSNVESVWEKWRKASEKGPLRKRLDYSSQLSAQLPAGKFTYRVAYTKSGNTLSAARITEPSALIENKLYWASTESADEARYLVGILNSNNLLTRVKPMQNLGLFGSRDFDKLVFQVPFGGYIPGNVKHRRLVSVVRECEQLADQMDLSTSTSFKAARLLIRDQLAAQGLAAQLEKSVESVLSST